MNYKYLFLLVFFFCTAFFVYANGSGEDLVIYYSSSLNGNLDGCDCENHPRSGLVKRAHFLRNIEHPERAVILDAGDIFDPYPDQVLSEYILQVYHDLGYDAIGVGEQEFSLGSQELLTFQQDYPFLCNNLTVCVSDISCVFFSPEPLVLERNGYSIGIISVTHPSVFAVADEDIQHAVSLSPPEDVLANLVPPLSNETDMVICIYHGRIGDAVSAAESVEGIDLMLIGHEQRMVPERLAGDTLIVSPGEEGNWLGELRIDFNNGEIVGYENELHRFYYNDDPDDPQVREMLDEYYNDLILQVTN
ncbi:MAG: hypothetical protein ACLFR1_04610 [Spirochaetia bacterium]